MHASGYRPEIDGLRALAVMPVVLFHLSAALVPAGYLGVDVFFVISGYLITRILVADLQQDQFDLGQFYERRARRILPALFVVIAASVVPAAILMLPGQQVDFGWAILSAIGFVSNLLYYVSTGYFMPSAEVLPLLHTWSLAVEEQFYLFFPLILLAAWRLDRKSLPHVLALLGIASLTVGFWLADRDPAAGFYLLPSRAWELMAGALAALWRYRPPRVAAETLSVTGLAMIAVGYFSPLTTAALFNLPALLPVGGAALFLWAGESSRVARLVGVAPLRWIGLISYSVYLWHWPLLAFWRLHGGDVAVASGAMIVAATLFLATMTYLYVEQPFRDRRPTAPFPRRALVPFLSTSAVALALFGILPLLPAKDGRGRDSAASVEARLEINYGLNQACEGVFTLDPACRTSDRPEILLWGDSFAMHLAPAIVAAGDWGGMIQMTKSSCAPILGLSLAPEEYAGDWYQDCIRFNDEVFAWLAGSASVRIVVLSTTFTVLFQDLRRPDGSIIPEEEAQAAVRDSLLRTAERIGALGKEVVIVSPPPVTGKDIGQCLAALAMTRNTDRTCDFPLDKASAITAKTMGFLHDLSRQLALIDLTRLICPEGTCKTRVGDVFVYRDKGHLSIEGAEWLGRAYRFDQLIRQTAAQPIDRIN